MEKAGNCSCMFGSLRKAREGSRSECRNESAENEKRDFIIICEIIYFFANIICKNILSDK